MSAVVDVRLWIVVPTAATPPQTEPVNLPLGRRSRSPTVLAPARSGGDGAEQRRERVPGRGGRHLHARHPRPAGPAPHRAPRTRRKSALVHDLRPVRRPDFPDRVDPRPADPRRRSAWPNSTAIRRGPTLRFADAFAWSAPATLGVAVGDLLLSSDIERLYVVDGRPARGRSRNGRTVGTRAEAFRERRRKSGSSPRPERTHSG